MDLYDRLFGNEFFNESGKPIYMDDTYFKDYYFSFISDREQARKKKGKCVFPDCAKKCVSSHTIPESAVLKRIAHQKNVLYPHFDTTLGTYQCKPISIGKASVFPGFCTEHEKLFSGFEINGEFGDQSIALQNLRVIYRYLFETSSLLKVFKRKLTSYKKELMDYQRERFTQADKFVKKGVTLIDINDNITEHLSNNIEKLEYILARIHNEDLVPFFDTLTGKNLSISIITVNIEYEVPICLAGKSEFKTNQGNYTVHLSIFPYQRNTFCCFSLPKSSEQEFMALLERYDDDLKFLKFIESWMIHGTDFWYINPIEWESYTQEKKEKILTQLNNTDHFPDEELDFMIFDNLRANYLPLTPKVVK